MNSKEVGFCPICSGVGEEAVSEILGFAKQVSFDEGRYIYMQDGVSEGVFVVLAGGVRLTTQNDQGKEFIVKKQSAGEIFGETGLFNEKSLESACAISPTTCIFLPKTELKDLMSRNAKLSASIITLFGGWIVDFYDRIQTLSITSVRERVERYFACEIKKAKHSKVTLKLKRHEMASNLGMRPETLSRVLSEFQKEGLITIDPKKVIDLSNFTTITQ